MTSYTVLPTTAGGLSTPTYLGPEYCEPSMGNLCLECLPSESLIWGRGLGGARIEAATEDRHIESMILSANHTANGAG